MVTGEDGSVLTLWDPVTQIYTILDEQTAEDAFLYFHMDALVDGNDYYYRVFPYDCDGNFGTPSPTPTPMATPTATQSPTMTETPTTTSTPTVSPTPTMTQTPTMTPTVTETPTETPFLPMSYPFIPRDSGDLNGDGHEDIVGIQKKTLIVVSWTSSGYVRLEGSFGSHVHSVFIKDFNDDEFLDFIIGENRGFSLYVNNGAGAFSLHDTVETNYTIEALTAIDCDGDGDNDIVVAGKKIAVFRNELDMNGGFSLIQELPCSASAVTLFVGDLNGDANPDIISGGKYFTGHGDGTFSDTLVDLGMRKAMKILGGDLDQDGDTDLVVLDRSSSGSHDHGCFSVLANDGSGSLDRLDTVPLPVKPVTGIIGDWDNDGDLDFLIGTGKKEDNPLYFNDGAAGFTSLKNLQSANPFGNLDIAGAVTFDVEAGDGDLDIIAGSESDGVFLFRNNAALYHVNQRPSPPTDLASFSLGGRIVLCWGSGSDAESSSLHYFLRVGHGPGSDDIVETEIGPISHIKTTFGNSWYARIREIDMMTKGGKSVLFYWAVAAADHTLARSEWSADQFVIPAALKESSMQDVKGFLRKQRTTEESPRSGFVPPGDYLKQSFTRENIIADIECPEIRRVEQ